MPDELTLDSLTKTPEWSQVDDKQRRQVINEWFTTKPEWKDVTSQQQQEVLNTAYRNYAPVKTDTKEPATSTYGNRVIDYAMDLKNRGSKYVWGGEQEMGTDCSGLTCKAYKQGGVELPRTAREQFGFGRPVQKYELLPGDQVFFDQTQKALPKGTASHTGIYLGDGQFIHQSSSGGTKVSRIDEKVYTNRYLGARRHAIDQQVNASTIQRITADKAEAERDKKMREALPNHSGIPIDMRANMHPSGKPQYFAGKDKMTPAQAKEQARKALGKASEESDMLLSRTVAPGMKAPPGQHTYIAESRQPVISPEVESEALKKFGPTVAGKQGKPQLRRFLEDTEIGRAISENAEAQGGGMGTFLSRLATSAAGMIDPTDPMNHILPGVIGTAVRAGRKGKIVAELVGAGFGAQQAKHAIDLFNQGKPEQGWAELVIAGTIGIPSVAGLGVNAVTASRANKGRKLGTPVVPEEVGAPGVSSPPVDALAPVQGVEPPSSRPAPTKRASRAKTGDATWTNNGVDQAVFVEKTLGKGADGRTYVKIRGSEAGIPLDEVTFVPKPRPSTQKKSEPVQPVVPQRPAPATAGTQRPPFMRGDTFIVRETGEKLTVKAVDAQNVTVETGGKTHTVPVAEAQAVVDSGAVVKTKPVRTPKLKAETAVQSGEFVANPQPIPIRDLPKLPKGWKWTASKKSGVINYTAKPPMIEGLNKRMPHGEDPNVVADQAQRYTEEFYASKGGEPSFLSKQEVTQRQSSRTDLASRMKSFADQHGLRYVETGSATSEAAYHVLYEKGEGYADDIPVFKVRVANHDPVHSRSTESINGRAVLVKSDFSDYQPSVIQSKLDDIGKRMIAKPPTTNAVKPGQILTKPARIVEKGSDTPAYLAEDRKIMGEAAAKGNASTDDIFIRLATKAEIPGGVARRRAVAAIPAREGFEIGYKPYGEHGKGFYYTPISDRSPMHLRPNPVEAAARLSSSKTDTSKTRDDVGDFIHPTGSRGTVKTPVGRKPIEYDWAVVPIDEIIASNTDNLQANPKYDPGLQPRDRNAATTRNQIERIARELDPEDLGESSLTSDGAPLIGTDLQVESGNGRVMALRFARESYGKNWGKYQKWVRDNAERFGIDPSKVPDGSVLVRVRKGYGGKEKLTGIERERFVLEAGESPTLEMGAGEKARLDARRMLSSGILKPNSLGHFPSGASEAFVHQWLSTLSKSEVDSLTGQTGKPNKDVRVRLNRALAAAVVDDPIIVNRWIESVDDNTQRIFNAVRQVAPKLATIRQGAETGSLHDFALGDALAEATTVSIENRAKGWTTQDWLDQAGLFGEHDPLVHRLVELFEKHKNSATKMAQVLDAYADVAIGQGHPGQKSFDKKNVLTKLEALESALGLETERIGQQSIFGEEDLPASAPRASARSNTENGRDVPAQVSVAEGLFAEPEKVAAPTRPTKEVQGESTSATRTATPTATSKTGTGSSTPHEGRIPDGGRSGLSGVSRDQPTTKAKEASTSDRIVTARSDRMPARPSTKVSPSISKHLMDHQEEGASRMIDTMDKNGGGILADGTGTGKTRQILAVAQTYAERGQPVLIIAPGEVLGKPFAALKSPKISGSYADDAAAMGVQTVLTKGEALQPGKIYVTTYERLAELQSHVTSNTVVIFDEAHALKNLSGDTKRAIQGVTLAVKADKVMFATATPADKVEHILYLERAGAMEGKTAEQQLSDLGMNAYHPKRGPNAGKTVWMVDKSVGAIEVKRRLSELFNRLTSKGGMVKRELRLDGVDVRVETIKMSKEVHDLMSEIEDFKLGSGMNDDGSESFVSGLKKAQIRNQQRIQQETFKVDHAVQSAVKDLADGKQVIIFVNRVNASEVANKDFSGKRDVLMGSEGTAKLLRDSLAKEGITDIAELHGGSQTKAPDAMKSFQNGDARVMIATIESGGTGINLDDVVGNRHRSMIIMTPPYTALGFVQAIGRAWRLKSKSAPTVRLLVSDTDIDQINAAILRRKVETLGATVQGETRKLDIFDPDVLDATDLIADAPKPTAQRVASSQTATSDEFPSLVWSDYTTQKGRPKKIAPATPEFWDWWNTNGGKDNGKGISFTKGRDGKYTVWSNPDNATIAAPNPVPPTASGKSVVAPDVVKADTTPVQKVETPARAKDATPIAKSADALAKPERTSDSDGVWLTLSDVGTATIGDIVETPRGQYKVVGHDARMLLTVSSDGKKYKVSPSEIQRVYRTNKKLAEMKKAQDDYDERTSVWPDPKRKLKYDSVDYSVPHAKGFTQGHFYKKDGVFWQYLGADKNNPGGYLFELNFKLKSVTQEQLSQFSANPNVISKNAVAPKFEPVGETVSADPRHAFLDAMSKTSMGGDLTALKQFALALKREGKNVMAGLKAKLGPWIGDYAEATKWYLNASPEEVAAMRDKYNVWKAGQKEAKRNAKQVQVKGTGQGVSGEERPEVGGGKGVIKNRADLKAHVKKAFNLSDEEADGVAASAEARARVWADRTGRTMGEWFDRIQVEKGGKPSKDALFQGENNKWYYSKAEQVVNDKVPNAGTSEQIRATLLKNGVKPDEMYWSGLDEFLSPGKRVTKQQLLDHLRENNVRVEEVVKGTNTSMSREQFDRLSSEEQDRLSDAGDKTKFSQYQLPGGENYRELLLAMGDANPTLDKISQSKFGKMYWQLDDPAQRVEVKREARNSGLRVDESDIYRSSHWDEPNVLAHIRFNERKGPNGERILHVEEIQSDWHQAGRDNGYQNSDSVPDGYSLINDTDAARKEGYNVPADAPDRWTFNGPDISSRVYDSRAEAIAAANKHAGNGGAVPNAPFKGENKWGALAAKRILRYAAENGFDQVSWTPGEKQADRYNLSKQVKHIAWEKNDDGTYNINAPQLDGSPGIYQEDISAKDLTNLVGKEVAQKIVDGDGRQDADGSGYRDWRILEGEDLKVGGKGIKSFYDRDLVNIFNDLGKRFGAKVERGRSKSGYGVAENVHDDKWDVYDPNNEQGKEIAKFDTKAEAEAFAASHTNEYPTVNVTPELRKSAMSERFPLFQSNKASAEFLADHKVIIRALENPDVSSAMHEFAHVFRRDLEETGGFSAQAKADFDVATKWATTDGKWDVAAEEKFARGFERYLREGKAPSTELKSVFENFKTWLTTIYKKIAGSAIDVKLSKEIRGVFDRLLAETEKVDANQQRSTATRTVAPAKTKAKAETQGGKAKVAEEVKLSERTKEWISQANDDVNEVRVREGKEPLTTDDVRTWKEDVRLAHEQGIPERAEVLVDEIEKSKRLMTSTESAGVLKKRNDLQNMADALTDEINQAIKDGDNDLQSSLMRQRDAIEKIADKMDRTVRTYGGTEVARALAIRNMEAKRLDFDTIRRRRLESNSKKPLTESERTYAKALADKLDAAEKRIAELEKAQAEESQNVYDQEQMDALEDQVRQERRARRGTKGNETLEILNKEYAGLQAELDAWRKQPSAASRSRQSGAIDAGGAKILVKMFVNRVKTLKHSAAKITTDLYDDTILRMADGVEDAAILTRRQFRDILSGYNRKTEMMSPEAQKLSAAKRALRIASQIEDVKAGKQPNRAQRYDKSEEVLALERELAVELKKAGIQITKPLSDATKQRMAKGALEKRIAELEKAIKENTPINRGTPPKKVTSPEIEAMRVELAKLSQQYKDAGLQPERTVTDAQRLSMLKKRLEKEIKTWESAGASGKLPPKRNPRYMEYGREISELQEKAKTTKAQAERLINKHSPWYWAKMIGNEAVNIPLQIGAGADISNPFRQGLFLAARNLKEWGASWRAMVKAVGSEEAHQYALAELRADKNYELFKRSGGYMSSEHASGHKEEFMPSELVSKLPVFKQGERAFSVFGDTQRLRVFSKNAERLRKWGLTPEKDFASFRAIAELGNLGTGRGPANLGMMTNVLRKLAFSLKFQTSRLKLLNPVYYLKQPPGARRIAIENAAAYAGLLASIAALVKGYKALNPKEDIDVDISDPRSADFLQVRYGKTRYDFLAGFRPWINYFFRALTYMTKTGGRVKPLGTREQLVQKEGELLIRVLESKLSPLFSAAVGSLRGEDYIGNKTDVKNEAKKTVTPMVLKSALEALKDDPQAIWLILGASEVGIGTTTYGKKSPYTVDPIW